MYPFERTGELQEQGGAPVVGVDFVPCSIWPQGQPSSTPVGQYRDLQGVAPKRFATMLAVPNRQLVIDGVRYKLLAAETTLASPWVDIRLRRAS